MSRQTKVWAGWVWSAAIWMSACFAAAQTTPAAAPSWIERWQSRATKTQDMQPRWATPVATSTPRIDQGMRMEFVRQTNTKRYETWNMGNNKGLELIPERHTEIIFGVPPFFRHSQPDVEDGFGDVWFQGKYRLLTHDERHGNMMLTAILYATIPTGKSANGSCCAMTGPTIAAGKGFGRLALLTTIGGTLPVTHAKTLGRTVGWNTAAEFRVGTGSVTRLLTPEIELNSSFHHGGANDRKISAYGTLGLVLGRIPLEHGAAGNPGRRALTLAAGEQIALTHFHTYNHELILSVRLPF